MSNGLRPVAGACRGEREVAEGVGAIRDPLFFLQRLEPFQVQLRLVRVLVSQRARQVIESFAVLGVERHRLLPLGHGVAGAAGPQQSRRQ